MFSRVSSPFDLVPQTAELPSLPSFTLDLFPRLKNQLLLWFPVSPILGQRIDRLGVFSEATFVSDANETLCQQAINGPRCAVLSNVVFSL